MKLEFITVQFINSEKLSAYFPVTTKYNKTRDLFMCFTSGALLKSFTDIETHGYCHSNGGFQVSLKPSPRILKGMGGRSKGSSKNRYPSLADEPEYIEEETRYLNAAEPDLKKLADTLARQLQTTVSQIEYNADRTGATISFADPNPEPVFLKACADYPYRDDANETLRRYQEYQKSRLESVGVTEAEPSKKTFKP